MKSIEFSVPGSPYPKGRPRFSRKSGFAYTPTKTRHAEDSFVALAAQHRPKQPITTAIRLQLTFCLPIPQSKSKKLKAAMAAGEKHHTTRPDLDNLCKMAKDAMNSIFWMDSIR